MRAGDVVEVDWEDHTFVFGTDRPTITHARTIGYFVEANDDFVVVALTLQDGKPADMQLVDRRMLTRVRVVRRERA